MAPLMRLDGKNHDNSVVELHEDRLTIKYSRSSPQYEIPVKTIVLIRSSPPGLMSWGSLHFKTQDDYGHVEEIHYVLFNNRGAADVEKLRLTIEELRKKYRAQVPVSQSTPASSNVGGLEKRTPLLKLEGRDFYNDVIELYEDRLWIKKKVTGQAVVIPIKSIARIDVRGFAIGGRTMYFVQKDDDGRIKKGDPVMIGYKEKVYGDGDKLQQLIEDLMNGIKPQVPVSPGPQASSNMSELEKLADFKARGIITDEEFQVKKQLLLFGGLGGPVLREKETIREIVRVPCAYCGMLVDVTSVKCPGCGAPAHRR